MISAQKPTGATVKFLCSYGGRIRPRPSDGLLRYVGGHTRVVSVLRAVSFTELMMKLSDMCGHSVALRCQLPDEEMDVLVSVKSDEDLASIIDEYDRASSLAGKELKIRAILSPTKPSIRIKSSLTPSSSSSSCSADISPTNSADELRYVTRSLAPKLFPRPISPPSSSGFTIGSRSGSMLRAGYNFDRCWNRNRFQPCHVQAHYRPLVAQSNYQQ